MIPIGTVVHRELARHVDKFRGLAKAATLGEDPEAIHEMRVRARRIRVALRAYRAILPSRLIGLDCELKWIAASLGSVRDVDVQGGCMPELSSGLNTLRAERFDQLLADLTSPRYTGLVEGLTALSRVPPHETLGQAPTLEAAPDIIGRAYRSFKRARSTATNDDGIHRLRKTAKRLRYTFDPFASAYGAPARAFALHLRDLQEVLGRFQDAVVALELIAEMEPLAAKGDLARARDLNEAAKREAEGKIEGCLEALSPAWKKLEKRMAKVRSRLWK